MYEVVVASNDIMSIPKFVKVNLPGHKFKGKDTYRDSMLTS
jgi:hypothetical protein